MQQIESASELRKTIPWRLIVIFIFFSIAIIVGGIFFYMSQRDRIFTENQNSLTAISTLKIGQIEQWRKERLGNAVNFRNNGPLIRSIKKYFDNENQPESRKELLKWMESVYVGYDYSGVALLDTQLKTRLSISRFDSVRIGSIKNEISLVLEKGTIVLTDLHKTINDGKIYMVLLIPLIESGINVQRPFGILVLRIDPDKILFPLIQSWPTPSESSETLILRKDGDSITYLNELRHLKNTALNLKLPLTNNKLLASMAVYGQTGVVEGNDYRNIEVVGFLTSIPDLNWFMVAKIDKEEMQAPLKRYFVITILFCVVLILINASVFGFFIWNQRIKMYRLKRKDELAIRESEEKFNIAFRMSPVSVTISTMNDNKFIDINNTFLKDMEYRREEVIGRTAKELDIWGDESERLWVINELAEKQKIFGKVISYKSKKGNIIFGLSSMAIVYVNGVPCNISTVVNVTEIRKAERKLIESEEQYRTLFESINDAVMVSELLEDSKIGKFIQVNDAACKRLGYSREELLSMTPLEINSEGSKQSISPKIRNIIDKEYSIVEAEHVAKDGRVIPVEISTKVTQINNKTFFLSIARDITERKLAERKLSEEKERIRTILDQVGDPIFVKDNDHRIVLANRAFYDIFCMDEKSVIGYTLVEAVPENERHHFLKVDRSVLDTGITDLREEELTVNNFTRTIITRKVRFTDGSGKRFLVGSIHDITDRKKMEDELHSSENKFRQTFELSPVGIVMVGLDKKFLRCNNSFSNSLGYRVDQLVGKTISEVTLPEDQNLGMPEMLAIAQGQFESAHFQKRYLRIDGSIVWGDVLISLVRDNAGNPQYFLAIIQDITESKLAENEIRLQSSIMSHMGEAVYLVRLSDGIIVFANKGFEMMFGYLQGEMIGKHVSKVNAPAEKSPEETATEIIKTLKERGVWIGEVQNIKKDGTYFWTHANVTIFDLPQFGEVLISVQKDITEQKNAELQIKKLNAELEEKVIHRTSQLESANKELEAFSYSVSHDLRALLRSVHGYTKILLEEYDNKLDDEGKRICKIITESATQMGGLIDDLLSFSRIGRSNLNPTTIDMKKLVRQLYEGMTSPGERDRIVISIGKLQKSYGDVALIGQVWINLLSNAIKYSSKKEVSEISIGSEVKAGMVTYFVKDNGVGFDMEYAHKLFGVFQRLHSEREFEGNGVGLAIVQRIILKHGGKVWAEGEIGKGATFYFSLPVNDEEKGNKMK